MQQQQQSSIKLEKLCPKCNRQFAADDTAKCCPDDNALLAPVSKALADTVIDERYKVLGLIGSGSSSEVYLAKSLRLNKNVALKILHLSLLSDPARVQRFQAEAKAVTKLKHSSISEVHDFGLTTDGRPYMVMDYVEGMSLADKLSRGQIDEESSCNFLLQLLDALETAHLQGLVHRDIKPANIMISNLKENGKESIKLLDFGVARAIYDQEKNDVTRTGEVLGTPAYMSPEQCIGMPVDERSDIYSLGCVFYEMLTGERLVQANNPFDCMDWHMSRQMPAIYKSERWSDLSIILNRMLAKDADKRYQNTSELKADLEKVINALPLNSTRTGKKIAIDRKLLQHLLAAAAALLLLLLVASFFSSSNLRPGVVTPVQKIHSFAPADLTALSKLKFWGLYEFSNGGSINKLLIESNGYGPLANGAKHTVSDDAITAAYIPEQNLFYIMSGSEITKIDRFTKSSFQGHGIISSEASIRLNNLETITYDSKRKRLMVFGSGPGNHDYLAIYDPYDPSVHQRWTILLTPKNSRADGIREIRALSYDEESDRSFALCMNSENTSTIIELAPSGKKLGTIELKSPVKFAENGNQLYVRKGMAIVLVPPSSNNGTDYHLYVYELATGKLMVDKVMSWAN